MERWSILLPFSKDRFTPTSSSSAFPTFSQQLYQEQACSAVSDATFILKTSQEKQLNAFDAKCIRRILGIKWNNFVKNQEIREKSGLPPVSDSICKRCLQWLGHALRLPSHRLARQVLDWMPAGGRKKGRPKMNWRQTVEKDLAIVNRQWSETRRLAEIYTRWNALVSSTKRGSF